MRDDVLHSPSRCLTWFSPLGVVEIAAEEDQFRPFPPQGGDPVTPKHGLSARSDLIIGRSDNLATRIGASPVSAGYSQGYSHVAAAADVDELGPSRRQPVTSRPNATRAMLHSWTSLAPS